MSSREEGVHLILQDGEIVGFFIRDPKSNENVIFMTSKASLSDISSLFNKKEQKL